jgi:uncharacterized membrane protein
MHHRNLALFLALIVAICFFIFSYTLVTGQLGYAIISYALLALSVQAVLKMP